MKTTFSMMVGKNWVGRCLRGCAVSFSFVFIWFELMAIIMLVHTHITGSSC